MIEGLFQHGSMPALERMVQFTGARHHVLVDNIANLSTPYHRPRDLSPQQFQETLGRAIDQRRRSATPMRGELDLRDTREMRFRKDGIDASPRPLNEGIMFHDQNNRDLDRTMQRLAENTLAHRVSIDLLKNEFDMLRLAIRERL